jgi:hypothetical protein
LLADKIFSLPFCWTYWLPWKNHFSPKDASFDVCEN